MSNFDPNRPHEVSAEIRGSGWSDASPPGVKGRILTANTMQAHNTFDAPHAVRIAPFDDARYAGGMLHACLPGHDRRRPAARLSGGKRRLIGERARD